MDNNQESNDLLYEEFIKKPENQPISPVISKSGEFTIHDTKYGHCALCGRLGCHGVCFK